MLVFGVFVMMVEFKLDNNMVKIFVVFVFVFGFVVGFFFMVFFSEFYG